MRRGAGLRGAAVLAAVLGISAIPAVAYSTGVGRPPGQYPAKSVAAEAKKHKTAKKCKKGQVRKKGKCTAEKTSPPPTTTTPATTTPTPMTTTPAPEALSATLIVHPQGCRGGVPNETPAGERRAEEIAATEPLRIEKLGPGGKVLSGLITEEHTLHVAPGSYEVQVVERPAAERGLLSPTGVGGIESAQVTVGAGQTLEVTQFQVHIECK